MYLFRPKVPIQLADMFLSVGQAFCKKERKKEWKKYTYGEIKI